MDIASYAPNPANIELGVRQDVPVSNVERSYTMLSGTSVAITDNYAVPEESKLNLR